MTHFLALAFKLCFDLTGIESALVLFIVPLYYSLSGTATLRVALQSSFSSLNTYLNRIVCVGVCVYIYIFFLICFFSQCCCVCEALKL